MCLSCGCGMPEETHGDPAHITHNDLARAAAAAKITPKQAVRNMKATLKASKDRTETAKRVLAAPSAPKVEVPPMRVVLDTDPE